MVFQLEEMNKLSEVEGEICSLQEEIDLALEKKSRKHDIYTGILLQKVYPTAYTVNA